jgi:hypothetical protein
MVLVWVEAEAPETRKLDDTYIGSGFPRSDPTAHEHNTILAMQQYILRNIKPSYSATALSPVATVPVPGYYCTCTVKQYLLIYRLAVSVGWPARATVELYYSPL